MGRKIDDFKQSIRHRYDKTKKWCSENKDLALLIGMFGVSVIGWAAKWVAPSIDERRENRRLRSRIYDPQNGGYLYVKKPLTTAQMVELDRRRRAGQSVTQALDEMNVLKRR